jgi:hypothetical protein
MRGEKNQVVGDNELEVLGFHVGVTMLTANAALFHVTDIGARRCDRDPLGQSRSTSSRGAGAAAAPPDVRRRPQKITLGECELVGRIWSPGIATSWTQDK